MLSSSNLYDFPNTLSLLPIFIEYFLLNFKYFNLFLLLFHLLIFYSVRAGTLQEIS